jgi:decaprenyl-phosphate phosphoribosyltransferase
VRTKTVGGRLAIPSRPDAAAGTSTPRAGVRGLLAGLLRTARPRQWVKNVLVASAPLAAGQVREPRVLVATGLAFVIFCVAASAVYFLNDAVDVAADRAHPRKRERPVAAGIVPLPLAYACAAVLAALAILIAVLATNVPTAVVTAIYLTVNGLYCVRLKHVLVLDLALVSSGFLLRAVIGGTAAALPLSQWFLLVAGFGSLFMVAGKRYSEMVVMGQDAARSRPSLAGYTPSYLRFVWGTAAAVTIMTYCLWAFQISASTARGSSGVPWPELTVVPFCFAFLRYAFYVDSGRAGEPEDVVLGDPVILLLGLGWVALFALGVSHV